MANSFLDWLQGVVPGPQAWAGGGGNGMPPLPTPSQLHDAAPDPRALAGQYGTGQPSMPLPTVPQLAQAAGAVGQMVNSAGRALTPTPQEMSQGGATAGYGALTPGAAPAPPPPPRQSTNEPGTPPALAQQQPPPAPAPVPAAPPQNAGEAGKQASPASAPQSPAPPAGGGYVNQGAMMPALGGPPPSSQNAPGMASPESLAMDFSRFMAAQPRPSLFQGFMGDMTAGPRVPEQAILQAHQQQGLQQYLGMLQGNQAQQRIGLDAYLGQGKLGVDQAAENRQGAKTTWDMGKAPVIGDIIKGMTAQGKSPNDINAAVDAANQNLPHPSVPGWNPTPFSPGAWSQAQAGAQDAAARNYAGVPPNQNQNGGVTPPGRTPGIDSDTGLKTEVVAALQNAKANNKDALDALLDAHTAGGGDQYFAQNADAILKAAVSKGLYKQHDVDAAKKPAGQFTQDWRLTLNRLGGLFGAGEPSAREDFQSKLVNLYGGGNKTRGLWGATTMPSPQK